MTTMDDTGGGRPGPGIKVTGVAYVRFEAPDLDAMASFFADFGLHATERTADALYLRGVGDQPFLHVTHRSEQPSFVGLAFEAASVDDLHVLARFDDVGAVEDIDEPGGGKRVTAIDPNGFRIDVVADRTPVAGLASLPSPPRNSADAKGRHNAPLRLDPAPSHVERLGHVVLAVHDFRESEAWYKERFGLLTSDEILLDQGDSLGAFLRCDRGAVPVDHHSLFLVGVGRAGFNHAAFEVSSLDDLMLGHSHLAGRRHAHQWGVGRHVLGSQIYDYWLDPYGNMVEHWTDGDVFDHTVPPQTASLAELRRSQWGPMVGSPPN